MVGGRHEETSHKVRRPFRGKFRAGGSVKKKPAADRPDRYYKYAYYKDQKWGVAINKKEQCTAR